MCLLAVWHRAHPEGPLVLAANRDEMLDRPAVPMAVLQGGGPRVLGGRDGRAGGTWLAVNEDGVFAGLTNLPGSRTEGRRSRGELPLAWARGRSAAEAVEAFARLAPDGFNPAWLLAGDRETLYYVDFTRGPSPRILALAPGLYVMENKALGEPSPKVEAVRRALKGAEAVRGEALRKKLFEVLRSHVVPPGADAERLPSGKYRAPETLAACVHAGPYGTRCSTLLTLGPSGLPGLWYTEGPPCTHALKDASGSWTASV